MKTRVSMKTPRMGFRSTIKLTSIMMSLLLLMLGVSAAWYVYRLQRRNSHILDVNVSSVRTAEQLEVSVQNIRHELDWYLVSHDRQHLARALEMVHDVDRGLIKPQSYRRHREKKLSSSISISGWVSFSPFFAQPSTSQPIRSLPMSSNHSSRMCSASTC